MKVVETETSAATTLTVPPELLASPIYANVRARARASSPTSPAAPPFELRYGKHVEVAQTFERLRDLALDLAKREASSSPASRASAR